MNLSLNEQVLLCDMMTRFAPGYIGVHGPASCDYLPRQLENMAENVYNEVAEKLNYSEEKKVQMRNYFLSARIDIGSKLATVSMSVAESAPNAGNLGKWWNDAFDFSDERECSPVQAE